MLDICSAETGIKQGRSVTGLWANNQQLARPTVLAWRRSVQRSNPPVLLPPPPTSVTEKAADSLLLLASRVPGCDQWTGKMLTSRGLFHVLVWTSMFAHFIVWWLCEVLISKQPVHFLFVFCLSLACDHNTTAITSTAICHNTISTQSARLTRICTMLIVYDISYCGQPFKITAYSIFNVFNRARAEF